MKKVVVSILENATGILFIYIAAASFEKDYLAKLHLVRYNGPKACLVRYFYKDMFSI